MVGRHLHPVNYVGVNLSQRHQSPGMPAVSSEHSEEGRAVTFDRSLGVLLREAEIQRPAPITPGATADASGKTVDQPGQLLKSPGLQNGQLGFGSAPGWHAFILSKRLAMGYKPRAASQIFSFRSKLVGHSSQLNTSNCSSPLPWVPCLPCA